MRSPVAPGAVRTCTCKPPWSSSGKKDVGRLVYSQAVAPMSSRKTGKLRRARLPSQLTPTT